MFLAANLISALAEVISIVLSFIMWVIVIRALVSWVNPDPYNPIVQFLYRVTEPVLNPVRRMIPMSGIGIDLSPIIVILIIVFLRGFVVTSLIQLAQGLR